MTEKSPLSVLDFLATPGWAKARSRGAASPQITAAQGRRNEEHSAGMSHREGPQIFGTTDQAASKAFRRKGRGLPQLPNFEDTLDDSKVCSFSSIAHILDESAFFVLSETIVSAISRFYVAKVRVHLGTCCVLLVFCRTLCRT